MNLQTVFSRGLLLILALLILTSSPILAKTVYVKTTGSDSNDGSTWVLAKQTVQAGLNASVSGDEVWVAAGTYVECISLKAGVGLYGGFAGTETQRDQRDWKINITVLDGNQGGTVVTSPSGATLGTVIDGFTIRNGTGTLVNGYRFGGGIYCSSSSPTITNTTITGNTAFYGGGIYSSWSSPTITNNAINGNSVLNSGDVSGCSGGGVYCSYSSPTITNNTITGNSAAGGGGAINCFESSPTITNNTITGNSAADMCGSRGGVECADHSCPTITNNTITGNNGGGIYCMDYSSPTISNNTVAGNSSDGVSCSNDSSGTITSNTITGNHGGGICCSNRCSTTIIDNIVSGNSEWGIYCNESSPTITNNTIIGNSASQGGAIYCYRYEGWASSPAVSNNIIAFNSSGIYKDPQDVVSSPVLRNNDVYGNTSYNYSGLSAGSGDISVDPLLVSRDYGDLHIQAGSPCVNAGSNGAPALPGTDMDGQARVQGGTVDIGADESDGTTWPAVGPRVIVRVSPTGNDANDGSNWGLAKKTVQAGIDAAAALGGEVWVKSGTYSECITLRLYAYVYGGFAGSETTRSQRNWSANASILDGGNAGSVVTANCGHLLCAVDGFTIRRGTTSPVNGHRYGAGISCPGGSPAITNNTITGNYGGGISCTGSPAITNNTISGNSDVGIYCASASPAITNNTISSNSGSSYGGGICCDYSSPIITNNTITGNSGDSGGGIYCYFSYPTIANNTIAGNTAHFGAGVYCADSAPTITNNTIAWNSASGSGGGILCYRCSPTITNNAITGNSAPDGGGVCCDHSSPTIVNNAIAGNSASSYGGGIYCSSWSPTITNNTITGNSAPDGGGVCFSSLSSPAVSNNIVAFNSSGMYNSGGTPVLRNNDVYGNPGYSYSGLSAATGDISADPLFASKDYGNLHIQAGSPCVNAGWNDAPGLPAADMDGQVRIQGGTVDIGADESDGTTWPAVVPRIVRVSPTGNNANDGSSWSSAKLTVQAAIDVAAALGGEVWVKSGTYSGSVAMRPYAYIYGGFAGSETARSQRSWLSVATALDGGGVGSVVTANCGYLLGAIDGFAIRSGISAGIYCNSCPTITNNVITGNTDGGIYCNSCSPTITNNTIAGNRGRGICCFSSSSPTVSNNIVAFNSLGIYKDVGSSPVLWNNDVYGNTGGSYSGLSAGSGDISADPLLANRDYGDLHIQAGSPCVNAGRDGAPGLPATDMDGQARVRGGTVDIGADESDGTTWPTGPRIIVRVSPTGNDGYDGSYWSFAKRTVQAGINAAAVLGGEVWVKSGTYNGQISVPCYAYVYGGFVGLETARSQRNWTANTTILDPGGIGYGSVVTARCGYLLGAIDGFTIQSGAWSYGGISCSNCALTITNNTISGNKYGGISCQQSFSAITNNAIIGNNASYGGGGIYCSNCSPTIINNTITANSVSSGNGGGIYCGSYSSPTITNNTITGNIASSGGGICSDWYSSPALSNNIVAFNSSGMYVSNGGTPVLRNNDFYGNTGYNYSGLSAGTGDISGDPLFVNRGGGDYHLQANSLCLNSGWNDAPALPPTDKDGLPRVLYGTVDIGAYEVPYLVATPSFTPDGGAYCSTLNVGITCATPGAVIHYTTNGVDPSQQVPIVTGPVSVCRTTTLRARAWNAGLPSLVKSADYALLLLSDNKRAANSAPVTIGQAVVTAVASTGLFYVEADDRSCGIMVSKGSHGLTPGKRVTVQGNAQTTSWGEKYVIATSVTDAGTGTIRPLVVNNRDVGGADWLYNSTNKAGQKGVKDYRLVPLNGNWTPTVTDSVGMNNIGTLITTSGKVTYSTTGYFYIDDGYGVRDNSGQVGIKVMGSVPPPDPLPPGWTPIGHYVTVTGISSCFKAGAPSTDLYRQIWCSQVTLVQ